MYVCIRDFRFKSIIGVSLSASSLEEEPVDRERKLEFFSREVENEHDNSETLVEAECVQYIKRAPYRPWSF